MAKHHSLTDSLRRIIRRIPLGAQALGIWAPNAFSTPAPALWSLLKGEQKIGLVAIEKMVVQKRALSEHVGQLLEKERDLNPIVADHNRLVFILELLQNEPPAMRAN
jgi:hypothetical protein